MKTEDTTALQEAVKILLAALNNEMVEAMTTEEARELVSSFSFLIYHLLFDDRFPISPKDILEAPQEDLWKLGVES